MNDIIQLPLNDGMDVVKARSQFEIEAEFEASKKKKVKGKTTIVGQKQERHDKDLYETPLELCEAMSATAFKYLMFNSNIQHLQVLDPGAGAGRFGQGLIAANEKLVYPHTLHITGVELRDVPIPVEYETWYQGQDFLTAPLDRLYHLTIGNPPFGKDFPEGFLRKAMDHTVHGGMVMFILPLGFLAGQDRHHDLFRAYPPYSVYPVSQRPKFDGAKDSDIRDYGIFVWFKGLIRPTTVSYGWRWREDIKKGKRK